jgi:hypothetical protein
MCCESVFGECLVGHVFFLVEEDHHLERLNHRLGVDVWNSRVDGFHGVVGVSRVDMEVLSWLWFWMDLVMKH